MDAVAKSHLNTMQNRIQALAQGQVPQIEAKGLSLVTIGTMVEIGFQPAVGNGSLEFIEEKIPLLEAVTNLVV